jgi:ribosomal protein L11 methyltransferase
MAPDYYVLRIADLTSQQEDWLSQQAFSYGALGISEILPFSQPEGEEEVFTQIPEQRTVDVYFAQPVPHELLEALKAHCPGARLTIQGENQRDWLAEWKKGFQPFPLVSGHWVVPSWCEPPIDAKHCIWMEPGMAFGTGTHETTQLVAEVLLSVSSAQAQSCLDVGTGTGILAILARQLGYSLVHATEIEVDARRVARENFIINGATDIQLAETQVDTLASTYDVVIANIIDGVLVRIQEDLKARVKAGGWLILSGIIAEREQDFLSGFKLPPSIHWRLRKQKGDWLLFAARL